MSTFSIRSFLLDDRGQGIVEYALILAFVAVAAIAALRLLGTKSNNTFNTAAKSLSD
jgi:pilus assembly protein Flp/PilA